MSLINDALKRAQEAAPPPPPPAQQSMQAADERSHPKLPLVLIPVLLLFVVGLAVWFFAKGLEVARQVYHSGSAMTLHARETVIPEPETTQTNVEVKAESAHSLATPAPATPLPPPPSTNGFPQLKLQVLFYRAEMPTAVINTKTVGIGSRINGATVLSITRDGVQVVWHGEARELTLP
jgi:hypothetical protein